MFGQDEPEESSLTVEESGGFEQDDANAPAADNGWKDELNLAEFPIAALTDRVPNGQTTLVFEDKLERRDHPPIIRRLTIMGTAKHGLPTSTDDEVLVGLIQLTKRRSNFTERQGAVLALRADRDPRLAPERRQLSSGSRRPCTAGSAWC